MHNAQCTMHEQMPTHDDECSRTCTTPALRAVDLLHAAVYNIGMQELITQLLRELGEDPAREGLLATPTRVEKALRFLTSGYAADIDAVINDALFTVDYSEMVIVKDIDFYSLCEHHLLPFFGKCHIAYIPQRKVIGLSKIPRLVDVFARRLQVQERLTHQIAEVLRDKIDPLGVAVVMEGTHLCMSMRGVEKQNSFAVTSAMLGAFRDNARTRNEFLALIKHRQAPPSAADAIAPTSRACPSDGPARSRSASRPTARRLALALAWLLLVVPAAPGFAQARRPAAKPKPGTFSAPSPQTSRATRRSAAACARGAPSATCSRAAKPAAASSCSFRSTPGPPRCTSICTIATPTRRNRRRRAAPTPATPPPSAC